MKKIRSKKVQKEKKMPPERVTEARATPSISGREILLWKREAKREL